MTINFRPHHFLCALCFQGRGYSPAFVDNFQSIMNTLNAAEGDETVIQIISRTDSICEPCPHRTGHTCHSQANIVVLDEKHAAALQITAGDHLTWKEAKQRIAAQIDMKTFDHICSTCEWKPLGMCEQALAEHLKKHKP